MQFVLASKSPRREELLNRLGFSFEVVHSGFQEVSLEDPAETAKANARGKALALGWRELPVLAADTVVYLSDSARGGMGLGKAEDGSDTVHMLNLLRGRSHEVYSGVAVAHRDELVEGYSVTRVKIRPMPDAEVEAYAKTGEGVGKAGGYAIQGRAAVFVECIEGDYTNVVGLPLALTSRLLEQTGVRWY